jgi:hypothetical protein
MKRNWPVMIASLLCVSFVVGVWINAYRSHASPPTISAKSK